MAAFFTNKKILLPLLALAFFSVPLAANAGLSEIILAIVGYILGVAVALFNEALNLFVLQMGGLIRGTSGGVLQGVAFYQSIDIVWKVVRDLVNLSFIFGLVYVGFLTILDAGTDTKKILSGIIISALLVNFSLFIAKGIIDVANVTAVEIYNQMGITQRGTSAGTLGETFLARMGLYQLAGVPDPAVRKQLVEGQAGVQDFDGWLAYIVGASIFILVAGFVFFAGAILLAVRFVVLVIAMMLSPIAFAATVFPALKKWRDRWWDTILKQAFFAPAYLFMLYIALFVAQSYSEQVKDLDKIYAVLGAKPGALNDGFRALAFFLITTAMMVAALVVAKQMGAYGASFATKTAGKFTAGAVGYMGRTTLGRLGQRISQSQGLLGSASKTGVRGFLARRALGTSRFAARRSYDARVVADKTGLAKATGLDLGKAQAGGFAKIQSDRERRAVQYARDLGGEDGATQVARQESYAQVVERGLFGSGISLTPRTTGFRSRDDNRRIANAIRAYIRRTPDQRAQDALLDQLQEIQTATRESRQPQPTPPAAT